MSNNEITLTMIVKNEEKHLRDCLESFFGIYDNLQIIDTGSTDRTKEIASSFGAEIFDFEWMDDFSAARNFGLEKIKTNYTMTVDADDIIENEDKKKLISILSETMAQNSIIIMPYYYSGNRLNPGTINQIPRFWKSEHNLRFIRPIHERLNFENKKLKTINLEIPIIHAKKDPYQKSLERNIKLLKKQIENETDDEFTHYYLGNEYFNGQQLENAKNHYEKFLKKSTLNNTVNEYFALTNLGIIALKKGEIRMAKSSFEKALKINPNIIDSYLYLAEIELNLFSIQKAITLLNIAKQITKPPKGINCSNIALYNGMADKLLQIALNKL